MREQPVLTTASGTPRGRGLKPRTLISSLVVVTAVVVATGGWLLLNSEDGPAHDDPVLTMAAPLPGDELDEVNEKKKRAPRPKVEELDGPNRLVIGSLGVNAPLGESGAKPDGSLEIPLDASKVTRYDASSSIAHRAGVTVVTGHVTNGSQRGALYPLASIEVGESIETFDANNEQRLWRVTKVETHDPDSLPETIFTRTGKRQLVVVTCGGAIKTDSKGRRHYEKNVLVFAEPLDGDSLKPGSGSPKEQGLARARHASRT